MKLFTSLRRGVLSAVTVLLLAFSLNVHAGNTPTRPTVSGTLNVVSYVDLAGTVGTAGNIYSGLVLIDYGSSGNGNVSTGKIDLVIVDPLKVVLPGDFTAGHNGNQIKFLSGVIDQGNLPSSVTATGTTTSASTSATVPTAVASAVPASGSVTGTGIAVGATYTLSGTVVTLSTAASATQTAASLTFSASPFASSYWRFPVSYMQ